MKKLRNQLWRNDGKRFREVTGWPALRSEGVSHAHLPLAIAGYNGGKAAVERWLSAESAPIAPDVFMENIGYTETRRYVRKVLGYMQTYRLVYGE